MNLAVLCAPLFLRESNARLLLLSVVVDGIDTAPPWWSNGWVVKRWMVTIPIQPEGNPKRLERITSGSFGC